MAYTDIGFNEFLTRPQSNQELQQLDALEFDTFAQEIPGSKVVGGVISSSDGQSKYDLEEGRFVVNNGVEDLVILGNLPDGDTGLLIRTGDGKTLMKITETEQYMQSPNEHFIVNFIKEYILSKNEQGIPRALFGKLQE